MSSHEQKCGLTAAGLAEVTNALCNQLDLEGLTCLISTHEEADMPLQLHCLHTPSADVVVYLKTHMH